ncbi:GNAT family N-acetyltransferase [Albitalea terrae]|uniref:GNAT family N-acetyltransferase n=2 Tax=Piscinibacter terrae TaxID=2496871 RepID=A0A3N7HRU4_9BURK|nr:GNAT family N-acetyltransferase [Albitalea terrae]
MCSSMTPAPSSTSTRWTSSSRLSGPTMANDIDIRRLLAPDAEAYKRLRDDMLDGFPDAFTSDAESERAKPANAYVARFEAEGDAARFSFGAWRGGELVGAISCERDARLKVRHVGHIIGMMVRPNLQGHGIGRALIAATLAQARSVPELELLTLSVTSSNQAAVGLYEKAGFVRYGQLPHAIKLGDKRLGKDLMMLALRQQP